MQQEEEGRRVEADRGRRWRVRVTDGSGDLGMQGEEEEEEREREREVEGGCVVFFAIFSCVNFRYFFDSKFKIQIQNSKFNVFNVCNGCNGCNGCNVGVEGCCEGVAEALLRWRVMVLKGLWGVVRRCGAL